MEKRLHWGASDDIFVARLLILEEEQVEEDRIHEMMGAASEAKALLLDVAFFATRASKDSMELFSKKAWY